MTEAHPTHVQSVSYDPNTGAITHVTCEHYDDFEARRARGEAVVAVVDLFDPLTMIVDLETRKLVQKGGS